MTTDRKIFDFLPCRSIMAEIEYPGIAKLVSRLVWDQETVRSSRTTRTKSPLKSWISEGFFLFFVYCGAGFEHSCRFPVALLKEVVVDPADAAGTEPALATHIELKIGHFRLFRCDWDSFLPGSEVPSCGVALPMPRSMLAGGVTYTHHPVGQNFS